MKADKLRKTCPLCNHRNTLELDNKTRMLKLKCRTCGLVKFFPLETVHAK